MAFCKYCGLRLAPTTEQCSHCGSGSNPFSQETDSHTALITMPPEHVLKRRKSFPIRDALYTPPFPEYHPSQQGARVIRKTHWIAISSLFLISLILLISIYSLLSAGFSTVEGFLLPTPGSMAIALTPTAQQQRAAATPQQRHPITQINARQQRTIKPSASPTPDNDSSLQNARDLIVRYYQSINARDYYTAYQFWRNNPLSYTTFAGGFVNTLHDSIQFGYLSPQTHATVRIELTIQATEALFSKEITKRSVYQGYYLVQHQPDQTWKIIGARFLSQFQS